VRHIARAIAILMLLIAPALAIDPGEALDDPRLEARARAVSLNLRCLACQNQSIDDSDADLARDLRLLVRERIAAGDSDAEVLQYVVDRYGEFVLLKPVIAPHTLALWIAAPVAFLIGLFVLWARVFRRPKLSEQPLSEDEDKALKDLMSSNKEER